MISNKVEQYNILSNSDKDINNDLYENENEKDINNDKKLKPEIELTDIIKNEEIEESITKIEEEDEEEKTKFNQAPIKDNLQDEIKIKKRKFNLKCIIIEIIVIAFNCTSFLFYKFSLEGCFKKQSECIPLLSTMFLGRIVIYGVLAALLNTIEIFLIIFRIIRFYHLIYTILFYILIYKYDHGTKLDYHGAYNIVIVPLVIIIFFSLGGTIIIIIKSLRQKKKYCFIIISVIFAAIIIRTILFFHSFKSACAPWDKGLNNTVLDNSDEFSCKIAYPKKCLLYKINSFFDISRLTFTSCSPKYNHEKDNNLFINNLLINESLKSLSSLTHFGYPITVNNPVLWKNLTEYYDLPTLVLKNVVLMDLYNHPDKKYYGDNVLKPEVEIIYDKKTKKRSIEINLIKNETLSEERKKIEKNPNNKNQSIYNNILFIYIDCISRQHFLRIMKKTSSFLEKFMKYDTNLTLSTYQFMKLQSFCGWTNPNVLPMFYSSRMDWKETHIIKYLKQNGYITGHSHNFCSKEAFEYDYQSIRDSRIILDEYDHENVAMFCDPNYIDKDNPYPIFAGPYSILRRCISGYDSFHYVLEYGKQFWETYQNNKKYLRLNFQDAHEFSGQVSKYLDEPLYNFLNGLYEKKLLDDTAIFIVSDHGNSYFPYFYYYILRSDDSTKEVTYASFFLIVPNYKNEKNKKILNELNLHQQAFISPYDIHDTIMHIGFGDNFDSSNKLYSGIGKSLLSNFEYKNRNCNTFGGYIVNPKECLCEEKMK